MTNPDNVGGLQSATKLRMLIGQYWDIAYAEGREGRQTDNEYGDAARVALEIEQTIGELCRAAPAGGDDWPFLEEIGRDGKPTGYWVRKGSPAAARMSAPAGGEPVARLIRPAPLVAGTIQKFPTKSGATTVIPLEESLSLPPGEYLLYMRPGAPAGSGEVGFAETVRKAINELRAQDRAFDVIEMLEVALLRKLQQGADYRYRVLEVGETILEHDEYVNDYGQWAKVKPPFLGMAYMLNMRTVRRAASQGQEGGHARD